MLRDFFQWFGEDFLKRIVAKNGPELWWMVQSSIVQWVFWIYMLTTHFWQDGTSKLFSVKEVHSCVDRMTNDAKWFVGSLWCETTKLFVMQCCKTMESTADLACVAIFRFLNTEVGIIYEQCAIMTPTITNQILLSSVTLCAQWLVAT